MTAAAYIRALGLKPHPEGGFYRETYRSASKVDNAEGKTRNTATCIYYLLCDEDISHFHKIRSDELWLFHAGSALEILILKSNGELEIHTLGGNPENGEVFQVIIPAGLWFAARIREGKGFALASCIVAPGFDFEDFELADRDELIQQYPSQREIIHKFCIDK
ncbi:MAG: cupin domain-containing protein [Chitinophagaceae bacterium]|nr:cupin domain-containing protein [Chitinophagaceae bacterium]MCW5913459.1 cupin domain-containing protein [Chitinophagaceae bacterium]MCZ2395788.1 cupin domain-containing protein [Chitinophagales bacterium]